MTYAFGPFRLDVPQRRLMRGDEPVTMPDRHLDVLIHLLAHAGQIVSKDTLIAVAWDDVAVTDNSLEQAISHVRRTLGRPSDAVPTYIETHARRGYRFVGQPTVTQSRSTDDALSELLAPFRALVDGRAALETLDRDAVQRASSVFEQITRTTPDYAPGHLGLANALALQLESVRAERQLDTAVLERALHHASEACRLDPSSGEAWAIVSLLAHQSRDHARAIAAAQRAAALEPDNWRHHLRLAYASWGEGRLRASHRVLKLLPDFPLAHWLAATVHVARQAFDKAADELLSGAAAQDRQPADAAFKGVGLHLLLGLVRLAHSEDEAAAVVHLHRELSLEPSQHIYGREACANAWCALAAIHLRHSRSRDADDALGHALRAVPGHALALAAVAARGAPREAFDDRLQELRLQRANVEAAVAEAVYHVLRGHPSGGVTVVQDALARSGPGSEGWTVPVEPLLHVNVPRDLWGPVLTLIRSRAV